MGSTNTSHLLTTVTTAFATGISCFSAVVLPTSSSRLEGRQKNESTECETSGGEHSSRGSADTSDPSFATSGSATAVSYSTTAVLVTSRRHNNIRPITL